jgi:hypothetical protein
MIALIAGLACVTVAIFLIVVIRSKVDEDDPTVKRWQLSTLLPTSLLILLVAGASLIVKGVTGG